MNTYSAHSKKTAQAKTKLQATGNGFVQFVTDNRPQSAIRKKQVSGMNTKQLKAAININDNKALENEADTMGAKALHTAAPGKGTLLQGTQPGSNAALQAKFIIRNGKWVWVKDSYVLKDGESYPSHFQQRPKVYVEKGKTEVLFDKEGKQSSRKRTHEILTHKKLQGKRQKQGGELQNRVGKKEPKKIEEMSKELLELAQAIEKLAGSSVPTNHKEKINKLHKNMSGKDFRLVIKAQDEMTQSEGTSSFIEGLTPSSAKKELHEYSGNVLRLMSSLRLPTESVLAPVNYNGQITGQQHPTSDDQEVLEGGASGHAFSDRSRVQSQVTSFDSAMEDEDVEPNNVLLASLLSSIVSTLSTMSAPNYAKNLPGINEKRRDEQAEERERIKKMANLIAKKLGMPVNEDVQDFDEPWKSHETPSSPLRNSSKTPSIKKLNKQPVKKVQRLAVSVQRTALQLIAAMPLLLQDDGDNHNRTAFINYMQQVHDAVNVIDTSLPQNEQILHNMSNNMNQVFLNFRAMIQRRIVNNHQPGNATDHGGQRMWALEQFFAECGQMAVHNALVMVNFPDLTQPPAIQDLNNQVALGGHGNFNNFITENQVRQMLATAHRPDIPVLGNIGQVGGILDLMRQALAGNQGAFNHLNQFNLGPNEITANLCLLQFISGQANSIVMVLNTSGHLDMKAQGYHWITVRVTRQQNGQLGIQYLDSLNAPANYAHLFQGLRALLAHAPQQQLGHGGQQQQNNNPGKTGQNNII